MSFPTDIFDVIFLACTSSALLCYPLEQLIRNWSIHHFLVVPGTTLGDLALEFLLSFPTDIFDVIPLACISTLLCYPPE